MKEKFKISTFCLYRKIIVVMLVVLFVVSGCGEEGDDSPFRAPDGEYGIGDDNDTGGYFEVIDNKIYNLTLSMKNPPSYGSCMTIFSGYVIRPGESEPFMEFANTNDSDPFQRIIYFDPIEINYDGEFFFEESIPLAACEQTFTISGSFQNISNVMGTWTYTIAGESTTGSWWASLYVARSSLEPISLPTASIVIDGDRSDWQGIQPIISDKEGNEHPDADFDGTDLNAFYIARDDEFLYHMITLYDGNPDADRNLVYSVSYNKYPGNSGDSVPGDQGSAVFLSYPPDGDMVIDLAERVLTAKGSEEIGRYTSDYAAIGNKFLEYKIPLSDMKSIDGKYLSIFVHMLDKDDDDLNLYPISDDIDSMAGVADSGGGYSE